jgi:mevalonate kinase
MSYPIIYAYAGGKAILGGEHSVGYGCPALILRLQNLGVSVELDRNCLVSDWNSNITIVSGSEESNTVFKNIIATLYKDAIDLLNRKFTTDILVPPCAIKLQSSLPFSKGLGSSSSLIHVILQSLWKASPVLQSNPIDYTGIEYHQILKELEIRFHGDRSAGIDLWAVSHKKNYLWVENLEKDIPTFLDLPKLGGFLALIDSGIPKKTIVMVNQVIDFQQSNPEYFATILQELTAQTRNMLHSIQTNNLASLGAALSISHTLLQKIGISSPGLDSIVSQSLAQNSVGAKLTGAGFGGVVLALFATKPTDFAIFDTQGKVLPVYWQEV